MPTLEESQFFKGGKPCVVVKKHVHQGTIERKNKRCRVVCSCGIATRWVVKWNTAWNCWLKKTGDKNVQRFSL